jgi:predicted PhzF superfamily epimerase YddE/YHI9
MMVASVVSLTACATNARFETSGAGHPIFATVHGAHTIESRDTHVTIATEAGVVRVERDRARIADGPWEAIPTHVPVRITIAKRSMSLRAGSVTMSRTMR